MTPAAARVHDHACMATVRLADLPSSNRPLDVLAHCPASSTCLPVAVMPIAPEAELAKHTVAATCLLVAQSGSGHRWYQRGGRTLELQTRPSMIEIYEKGLDFDHCRWQGEAGRSVVIEFADANVESITHGEMQQLRLPTRHEWFDARVSGLALELANEALQQLPSGALYAQGLSVALLGLLHRRFAEGGVRDSVWRRGQLGPVRRRWVEELIEQQLASDLSLSRLADEAGLSVYHFVRAFKATYGMTPHRYVQQRRLQAAVKALQHDRRLSIADIALTCGFASQSHLTDVMHRRLGVTPRALREGR